MAGGGRRPLVVDGECVQRPIVTRAVESVGFTVVGAADLDEAAAWLSRLPLTELKIDRSFVACCETDPEAWKIIRATISLAHELGLDVVAEGVESASIEERLIGGGCDTGQGFLSGRPMPASAIAAWFDAPAATMASGEAVAAAIVTRLPASPRVLSPAPGRRPVPAR
jgi:predicted signal transduction protein with EAL and GGDEF domain